LSQLNTFSSEVRHNFEASLRELHEHACSRSYGLGSRLPWDEQYLIESLSDSTIYMAYYTVAHLLQNSPDHLDGSQPGKLSIRAEQLTSGVWDYIFLNTEYNSHDVDMGGLTEQQCYELRREFRYWYPVDLRVSGKDLVPNHLIYFLYNHCAMWPSEPNMWPKAVRANGHMLLNSEKMSKSTGNFLTLIDAMNKYSADGMRLGLADAGDTVEDANFVEDMADAGLLRLHTFLTWVKEFLTLYPSSNAYTGKDVDGERLRHCDKVFLNDINRTIQESDTAYRRMMYKEAVRVAFYDFQHARDRYREASLGEMRPDIVHRFIEVQIVLLSPICPHVCEYIWRFLLNKPQPVTRAGWPLIIGSVDEQITLEGRYIDAVAHEFRLQKQKQEFAATRATKGPAGKGGQGKAAAIDKAGDSPKAPFNHANIWVATSYPDWQGAVVEVLKRVHREVIPAAMSDEFGREEESQKIVQNKVEFPDNKVILDCFKEPEYAPRLQRFMKQVMSFVQSMKEKAMADGFRSIERPRIDEWRVLHENELYLAMTLGVLSMEFRDTREESEEASKYRDTVSPLSPVIFFSSRTFSDVCFINRQIGSGLFSMNLDVLDNETVDSVIKRLRQATSYKLKENDTFCLYRFDDPVMGPRRIPVFSNVLNGVHPVERGSVRFQLKSNDDLEVYLEGHAVGKEIIYELITS
jgi:leucyl-tRNA synthetase